MDIIKFEFLKLLKKSRGWLGPILVFTLIMIAYPLTVELTDIELGQSFFSILWIAALLVMMLATEDIFLEDFTEENQPSKTYNVDLKKNRIIGTVDGIKSINQAVDFILINKNCSKN